MHLRLVTRGELPHHALTEVSYGLVGGVVAGGASDGAARMGPGSAEVVAGDRGAVVAHAAYRAGVEELGQGVLGVEHVPVGQVELLLQVLGRQELIVDDGIRDVGGVLGEGVDAALAEDVALRFPVGVSEVVGSVLDENPHAVLALPARWSSQSPSG